MVMTKQPLKGSNLKLQRSADSHSGPSSFVLLIPYFLSVIPHSKDSVINARLTWWNKGMLPCVTATTRNDQSGVSRAHMRRRRGREAEHWAGTQLSQRTTDSLTVVCLRNTTNKKAKVHRHCIRALYLSCSFQNAISRKKDRVRGLRQRKVIWENIVLNLETKKGEISTLKVSRSCCFCLV